jgi:transcriptional regulator EpsA
MFLVKNALASVTLPLSRPKSRTFPLTAEEGERLLRILAESQLIRRHVQLFLWLQGEIQHFLPHQILISAWGDFENWNLKLDVISGLPGVRTEQLAHCGIDGYVKDLFARWVDGGRKPLVVPAADALRELGSCPCPVHNALRGLCSILVHGVRDERGGYDSLYIALHSRSFTKGQPKDRYNYLVDLLVTQIDAAFRRVAAFRFADTTAEKLGGDWLDLSPREHEILDGLCKGKTNAEIGLALNISPFTVKNHVRRILRKLGCVNRAQAAAKYSQALQEARNAMPK